jgi:hypothetical protein
MQFCIVEAHAWQDARSGPDIFRGIAGNLSAAACNAPARFAQ